MSLVPLLFSDWWEDLDHPHHLFDQHFGVSFNPDNLPERPSTLDVLSRRPLRLRMSSRRYHPFLTSLERKAAATRGSSTVAPDKDKFTVTLDVQQFLPEEIQVKVVDRNIVIEAKHEEREDEHGMISRQFCRKYLVPAQCDIDKVETRLSSDGIMTITAPRKEQPKQTNEKVIKIQYTGQPALKEAPAAKSASPSKEEQAKESRQAETRGKKNVKAA